MDTVWSESFIRIAPRQVMWENNKGCLYKRHTRQLMKTVFCDNLKCVVWQTVFRIDRENTFSVLYLCHSSVALLFAQQVGIFWRWWLWQSGYFPWLGSSADRSIGCNILPVLMRGGNQWIFMLKGNGWCWWGQWWVETTGPGQPLLRFSYSSLPGRNVARVSGNLESQ